MSYSAEALKWAVRYDHGAPLPTEENKQHQVATHHRITLRDEDSGDEVHRDMLRQYLRCTESGTGAWYRPTRGGGHAAGDRPLACARPHERWPREGVRQSGTGRTGALRGVRRHSRDHHVRVPALPTVHNSQSPPGKGGGRVVHNDRHSRGYSERTCPPLPPEDGRIRPASCTSIDAS
jgi:hypothetical protein